MKDTLPLLEIALNDLPAYLQEILQKQVQYPYSFLPASVTAELCKYDGMTKEKLGLLLLPVAAAFAEAPVSNFHVGAVAFDSTGNVYLGANFEFANTHIGQTIHAEQSAIAHAWSRGAKDLSLLVINYAPCGHCRQFINEVKVTDDFCILLPEREASPLSEYLPNAFGPADLGISESILGTPEIRGNDVISLAENACQYSHAPYSKSNSGIALVFDDGEIVTGMYGENAAFNPSLPPLQMALNYRRINGKAWRTVEAALLVESPVKLSQRKNTEELLLVINEKMRLDYRNNQAS